MFLEVDFNVCSNSEINVIIERSSGLPVTKSKKKLNLN